MLKIDWKQFAFDYVWFGFYFTNRGWQWSHTRNPLLRWKVVSMDRIMNNEFAYYKMDGTPLND